MFYINTNHCHPFQYDLHVKQRLKLFPKGENGE